MTSFAIDEGNHFGTVSLGFLILIHVQETFFSSKCSRLTPILVV